MTHDNLSDIEIGQKCANMADIIKTMLIKELMCDRKCTFMEFGTQVAIVLLSL